ncbi:hypothetical protein ACJX0J_025105, partial [Zea mays]
GRRGVVGFANRYFDVDPRTAKDGQYVKVTGVCIMPTKWFDLFLSFYLNQITCGALYSSYMFILFQYCYLLFSSRAQNFHPEFMHLYKVNLYNLVGRFALDALFLFNKFLGVTFADLFKLAGAIAIDILHYKISTDNTCTSTFNLTDLAHAKN